MIDLRFLSSDSVALTKDVSQMTQRLSKSRTGPHVRHILKFVDSLALQALCATGLKTMPSLHNHLPISLATLYLSFGMIMHKLPWTPSSTLSLTLLPFDQSVTVCLSPIHFSLLIVLHHDHLLPPSLDD
jgi:hypothetical protein